VLIDAEDVSNQEKINNITNNLIVKYNIQRPIIYKTYQMYRKDSLKNINDDLKSNHYNGFKIVRGAYYNQDKQSGLLYSKKEDTDKAFNEACDVIFNNLGQNKAFISTGGKKAGHRNKRFNEYDRSDADLREKLRDI